MTDESLLLQVAHQLNLAGLPNSSLDDPRVGGFSVRSVGDCVNVVWTPSEELSEVAFRALGSGKLDHPTVLHMGRIKHVMAEATLRILSSAGLDAKMSSDDMSPATVEVGPSPGFES